MNYLASLFDIRQFSKRQKINFFINVLIGIIIVIYFAFAAQTDRGDSIHNEAFDILIKKEAKNYSKLTDKNLEESFKKSAIYFMDISHENYKKWGEPLLTPRDKIAHMLNHARRNGAKVVIIDILLDKEDCSDGGKIRDKQLRVELEKMLKENSQTKVIFPVLIDSDGEINGSIYDDLIAKRTAEGRKIFFYAVPIISATASDKLNRFWAYYNIGKNRKGEPEIVWGAPILAAALAEDKEEELEKIAEKIKGQFGHKKELFKIELGEKKTRYLLFKKIFVISNDITIPSASMHKVINPTSGKEIAVYDIDESATDIYTQRIRYHLIPSGLDIQSNITPIKRDYDKVKISRDDLREKIVIIGNSSPDARDMHHTPLGPMAGIYIIGNATNTIINGMQPVQIGAVWLYIIELLVIILAAYLFLHMHSLIAQIVASLLILAFLFPLSWWIFKIWGLFFNFIIPVMGMAIHKSIVSFDRDILSRKKEM